MVKHTCIKKTVIEENVKDCYLGCSFIHCILDGECWYQWEWEKK